MSPDALNLLYTIVTILFILSMISERISNLIKLKTNHLKLKRVSPSGEKDRERGIMWLAIISGCIVALFSGADFFTLIEKGKLVTYADLIKEKDLSFLIPKTLIGIFLSGVFISLGSKFWHDMLDIVLQVANLKKSLAEQQAQAVAPDKSIDVLKNKLVQKTETVLPKLKQLKDFAGYDVFIIDGILTLHLKFFNQLPGAEEQKWYKDYFSGDNVEFNLTNLHR